MLDGKQERRRRRKKKERKEMNKIEIFMFGFLDFLYTDGNFEPFPNP